jgi:hypothetical protein
MASNLPSPWYGLWRDYSQQDYRGWTLTVTNTQSIAILAVLGALIGYTQSRWWTVSHSLLISILRPVQLPDSSGESSLQELSQGKAIALLIFRKARQHHEHRSMTTVSPWFGVLSLLNVLAFLVIGAIAPYFLAGGSETTNVRQLRLNPNATCNGLQPPSEQSLQ